MTAHRSGLALASLRSLGAGYLTLWTVLLIANSAFSRQGLFAGWSGNDAAQALVILGGFATAVLVVIMSAIRAMKPPTRRLARTMLASALAGTLLPFIMSAAVPGGESAIWLVFGGPAYVGWVVICWASVACLLVRSSSFGWRLGACALLGAAWGLCFVLVIARYTDVLLPTFDIEMWGLAHTFGVPVLLLTTIGCYAVALVWKR